MIRKKGEKGEFRLKNVVDPRAWALASFKLIIAGGGGGGAGVGWGY